MSLRMTAVGVIAAVLVVGAVGCDPGTTTPPAEGSLMDVATPELSSMTSTDSIEWVDDVLEFSSADGTQWKYERFGPEGNWTDVVIYRNGVLHSETELRWEGDTISTARWTDRTHSGWFESDAQGTVYNDDVSAADDGCDSEGDSGEGGESGGDEGGEPGECDGPMGSAYELEFVSTSFFDDCDEHRHQRNQEVLNAVGHAILAVLSTKAPTKVAEARSSIESMHAAYEHHQEYRNCLEDDGGEEGEGPGQ